MYVLNGQEFMIGFSMLATVSWTGSVRVFTYFTVAFLLKVQPEKCN